MFLGNDTRWTKDCGSHSTDTAIWKIPRETPIAHRRQYYTQIDTRKRLSDTLQM